MQQFSVPKVRDSLLAMNLEGEVSVRFEGKMERDYFVRQGSYDWLYMCTV